MPWHHYNSAQQAMLSDPATDALFDRWADLQKAGSEEADAAWEGYAAARRVELELTLKQMRGRRNAPRETNE